MSTPEAVEESRRKDEKNTEVGLTLLQFTSNCVVTHL